MSNSGPDSNRSQFFITFDKMDWLDGLHVVFGKCYGGLEVLDDMEKNGDKEGTPSAVYKIEKCGEYEIGSPERSPEK